MQRFVSTKLFKVLMIAALFLLLIFLNPSNLFNPVRSGFFIVLSPLHKFFYSLSIGFENTKEFVGSVGQLKYENEQLIKDNQALKADNAMLHDVENENDMLRQQIDLLPRGQYELSAAFVVGQDPNGTGNWLQISKGSDDGIRQGMPVIVSKGILIGRIQQVNAKNSTVILLTNPRNIITATTTEGDAKGVIRGEYGLGIILDMVLQSDSVKVGDSVVTSGVGGEIPKGLYVGTVQEVHPSSDHLFQQAVVIAPLQVSKIQIVSVIKSVK